jgi:hypothetical protein
MLRKHLKTFPKKKNSKTKCKVSFLVAKLTLLILETRGIVLEKFKL